MAPLNLLILVDDQHRHDALGCTAQGIEPGQRTWLMGHGDGPVQTPHLDRLAASGVRFSEAVANLPVCVPCRHSFITGLYPHQTGILANSHYWPDQPPVPILSTYLKPAGYATAAIGKMHWKSRHAPDEHVPDKRGFDFRVSAGNASDGPRDRDYTETLSDNDIEQNRSNAERFGSGGESRLGYIGDISHLPAARLPEAWLADRAIEYLQNHRHERGDRPFSLIVSLSRPHPPNVIPADYVGMFDPASVPVPPTVPSDFQEDDHHIRRQIVARDWGLMDESEIRQSVARYLTNVRYVDDCLGRVLTALIESGYAENTLVVYFSDHGEMLGERAGAHTKYCLYESSVRVPLIVRWPGISQAGLVSRAPIELIDLMPTWLEAAEIPVPAMLPGRSLRSLLAGEDPKAIGWREVTLSEQYTSVDDPNAPRAQWTVRDGRYKLIERVSARSALYDLREDPNEFHNRIDEPGLADVRERLRESLIRGVLTRAEQFPAQHSPVVAIARGPVVSPGR